MPCTSISLTRTQSLAITIQKGTKTMHQHVCKAYLPQWLSVMDIREERATEQQHALVNPLYSTNTRTQPLCQTCLLMVLIAGATSPSPGPAPPAIQPVPQLKLHLIMIEARPVIKPGAISLTELRPDMNLTALTGPWGLC